jgi:DNA polymerase-3 subunit gamma/tau
VGSGGQRTIAEARDADQNALKAEAMGHPLVRAVFEAFPSAKIIEIRTAEEIAQEAAVEALPEVENEWDPFEEE